MKDLLENPGCKGSRRSRKTSELTGNPLASSSNNLRQQTNPVFNCRERIAARIIPYGVLLKHWQSWYRFLVESPAHEETTAPHVQANCVSPISHRSFASASAS